MFSQSLSRHASRLSAAIAVLGVSAVCAGSASAHPVSTHPGHAVATSSAVKTHARYGNPRLADSTAPAPNVRGDGPDVVPAPPALTQAQINQIITWFRTHIFMFPRGSFG